MAESVIYELHVKGYTRLHPLVPEHLRGTFSGLAHPAVIEHLVSTGVTAVELLPIHHFVSEPFVVGSGLANYWGYNTMGFFAPQESYGAVRAPGQQVSGFKEMVAALHEAGIEVILDVVYNHTGEGGHEGPTLSFRGIDHGGYYRLTPDNRNDYDVTGTGNSVDTSELGVQRLILDSLRYWVTEMGVDGFRFDLATTLIRDANHHVDQDHPLKLAMQSDPALEGVKLIAEPWDVGPYGYQVGAWGPAWSEWNDRFRGYVRDYWRGTHNGVQELATRLSGSPDLYDHAGRTPEASVNFVTAHDGFTVRDLVSYDRKHNDANKEHNRDGTDDNRSWNCGVEGETEDPARHRAASPAGEEPPGHDVPGVRHADDHRRRRVRPYAAGQQQRVLPGRPDLVGRLGPDRGLGRRADVQLDAARAARGAPGAPVGDVPPPRRRRSTAAACRSAVPTWRGSTATRAR